MKLLILSLLVFNMLFASNALEASKILGVENSYEAAIAKAEKEKKMLVLVIVKEHCRWCDKLIDKTLSDPKVTTALKDFVMVIVDKDDTYPSAFNENFFPSIFYIDYATQKSVYANVGFVGSKCFLNDLTIALETHKNFYEEEE